MDLLGPVSPIPWASVSVLCCPQIGHLDYTIPVKECGEIEMFMIWVGFALAPLFPKLEIFDSFLALVSSYKMCKNVHFVLFWTT